MAEADRWLITSCCGAQNSVVVQVDNWINQPGLYSWNLATQEIGTTGFFLVTNRCYTIQEISPGDTGPTIDLDDFDPEFTSPVGNPTCADFDQTPCSCPNIYSVSPCCIENGPQEELAELVNLELSDLAYQDGTYVYNGDGSTTVSIPGSQLILVPGQCYTITLTNFDPAGLLQSLNFDITNWELTDKTLACDDVSLCNDCEEPGITYLKFEPCCEEFDTIYVKTDTYVGGTTLPIVDVSAYTGVLIWNEASSNAQLNIGFVFGQCYTGTLHTLGSETAPAPQDNVDYNNLPLAPYETSFNPAGDCTRPECDNCPTPVYSLTNCDGGIPLQTESDLSAYIGTYVEIMTPGGQFIPGCWFVQEFSPISDTIDPSVPSGKAVFAGSNTGIINTLPNLQTQPVVVTGSCECDCLCYEVIGYSGRYSYIDCETGKTLILYGSGADKFCASGRPNIQGKEGIDYTLVIGDECVDGECEQKCFLLSNCDPAAYPNQDATLDSTLQSLSQYANTGEVVVLSGYDGCWTVVESEQCDCPVDVTVIRNYIGCEECLGITAYKLSNCEKINEVIYTLQDFSAYVGQVIKDDCACWVVEEIDYQPPSETTIVDPIVFEDCNTCLTTYYTLTDCDNPISVIISSTNLSPYVGQVVKVEGCDPCYEVALYEETTAPILWEEVTVTEASASCPECKQLAPRCSTVFNNSTEDRTFTYINANGDSEETELVKSGHFSLRTCVQYWDEPDTFIYNYYGDCTVYEYSTGSERNPCDCFTLTAISDTNITYTLQAVHLGQMYNNNRVWEVTIDEVPYFVWSALNFIGGWVISQQVGGSTSVGDATVFGAIKSGILDCPAGPDQENPLNWGEGGTIPGVVSKVGSTVSSLTSFVIPCSGGASVTKVGHCVQYFPNDRKVRPGYNTPICSADKYDKITCNAADIMYKKVLELRYGISDCCPEENEKWLIKKELIELQALTDPNYTCDPLTDCCGQRLSSCSCNS